MSEDHELEEIIEEVIQDGVKRRSHDLIWKTTLSQFTADFLSLLSPELAEQLDLDLRL